MSGYKHTAFSLGTYVACQLTLISQKMPLCAFDMEYFHGRICLNRMTSGIKFDLALEVLNVTFERLNIFFYTQYTMQHFYLQFEIVALTSRGWSLQLKVLIG